MLSPHLTLPIALFAGFYIVSGPVWAQDLGMQSAKARTYTNNNWQAEIVSKYPGTGKFFWMPLNKTVRSLAGPTSIKKTTCFSSVKPVRVTGRRSEKSSISKPARFAGDTYSQTRHQNTQATLVYSPTHYSQNVMNKTETATQVTGRMLSGTADITSSGTK